MRSPVMETAFPRTPRLTAASFSMSLMFLSCSPQRLRRVSLLPKSTLSAMPVFVVSFKWGPSFMTVLLHDHHEGLVGARLISPPPVTDPKSLLQFGKLFRILMQSPDKHLRSRESA